MDRPVTLRLLAFAVLAGAAGLGAVVLTRSAEMAPAPVDTPAPVAAATEPTIAPVLVSAPPPPPKPVLTPIPEPYVVRRVMTLPGPLTHGRSYWDEAGAPAEGPIVITVDLEAQVLSVFRGGYEIGTAVILYGANDKPTPLGVFKVTQKDADHVSNLYGAPMPYMLRLTNDGISIHGSNVLRDTATHGCVGVPTSFAKKLFGVVKLGDRVIVTNGERLQVGEAVKAAG